MLDWYMSAYFQKDWDNYQSLSTFARKVKAQLKMSQIIIFNISENYWTIASALFQKLL